jgi:hypothetical protein
MVETTWMVETTARTKDGDQAGTEEGAVLAAALAAVLLEYRRYLKQQNSHDRPAGSDSNWQMVSRLEQLRSLA